MRILWTADIKNLVWCPLTALSVVLCLCGNGVQAKSFGKQQTVFGVDEMDMLSMIESNAKHFVATQWPETQKNMQERAKTYVKSPPPVKGIHLETVEPRTFYYTVSMTMPEDVVNAFGKVVVPKGAKSNPLDAMRLESPLVFIDGDNAKQVEWARHTSAKIILVKGSPFELGHQLQQNIYFDQQGAITGKLGIKQVPAMVSQWGKQLLVEEVRLND